MLEEGGMLLLISLDDAVSLYTSNDMPAWEETWTYICSSQHGNVIPGLPTQDFSLSCLMKALASMQIGTSPTGEAVILKQTAAQNPPRLLGADFHVPGSS